MSDTKNNNPDRIDQLMVDAATQGLAPQDEAELRDAIERDPSLRREADAYELAATAIELALVSLDTKEAMPASLREKLKASAKQHSAKPSNAAPLKLAGSPVERAADTRKPGFAWTDGRYFGWYAAAAAMIALCVLLIQQPGTESKTPPTLAEQYNVLASDTNTLHATWAPHPDGDTQRFANAAGEVIWNNEQQTGYMKLTGLPVNDPTREQYQLWIVDATRGSETTDRIDGGVFNVNAKGEVIIPIDPKIVARKPAVFAITVEQPGGVVVSQGPLQV